MDLTLIWRNLFAKWPANLPRKGVVVSSYGEQIAFVQFLIGEHAVLLERMAPDAVGGRKVIIPYAKIDAVKTVDPVSNETLIPCGFLPPPTADAPARTANATPPSNPNAGTPENAQRAESV